jgi:putative hydrolase of the HAD superfamily
MGGLLIWDWDGTLGHHEGMFSGSMEAVLMRELPSSRLTGADFRPHLRSGFPWQNPEVTHPQITTAEQWWEALQPIFAKAYAAAGVDDATAARLAGQVRAEYLKPQRFKVYDDSGPTLEEMAKRGWAQVVLSNHVPELENVVTQLPLGKYLSRVFVSGCTGFEKPNPMAFRLVLDAMKGCSPVWMIGDSMKVDIEGAKEVGVPGILVRRYDPSAERYAEFVSGVIAMVSQGRGID